jgi:hypothetical protein
MLLVAFCIVYMTPASAIASENFVPSVHIAKRQTSAPVFPKADIIRETILVPVGPREVNHAVLKHVFGGAPFAITSSSTPFDERSRLFID